MTFQNTLVLSSRDFVGSSTIGEVSVANDTNIFSVLSFCRDFGRALVDSYINIHTGLSTVHTVLCYFLPISKSTF